MLYCSNNFIKFNTHLFNVTLSTLVLYSSTLKELSVVAKVFPDLSTISPLAASTIFSLDSLVFEVSLYSSPFKICSSNNLIIKIAPIIYTITIKILNLKFVVSFFILFFNISPSSCANFIWNITFIAMYLLKISC